MNLREFTDEFAELDGQVLQASAQAEATLSRLLRIESRLAQAKQTTRIGDSDDAARLAAEDRTE